MWNVDSPAASLTGAGPAAEALAEAPTEAPTKAPAEASIEAPTEAPAEALVEVPASTLRIGLVCGFMVPLASHQLRSKSIAMGIQAAAYF